MTFLGVYFFTSKHLHTFAIQNYLIHISKITIHYRINATIEIHTGYMTMNTRISRYDTKHSTYVIHIH